MNYLWVPWANAPYGRFRIACQVDQDRIDKTHGLFFTSLLDISADLSVIFQHFGFSVMWLAASQSAASSLTTWPVPYLTPCSPLETAVFTKTLYQ